MAWRSIKSNAKVVEVPITFVEREQGASKMTTSIVAEALWLVTKWGISRFIRRES
jgi:dolichol-phosphate mannosyltransferase